MLVAGLIRKEITTVSCCIIYLPIFVGDMQRIPFNNINRQLSMGSASDLPLFLI